jgi:hypothetical protein
MNCFTSDDLPMKGTKHRCDGHEKRHTNKIRPTPNPRTSKNGTYEMNEEVSHRMIRTREEGTDRPSVTPTLRSFSSSHPLMPRLSMTWPSVPQSKGREVTGQSWMGRRVGRGEKSPLFPSTNHPSPYLAPIYRLAIT